MTATKERLDGGNWVTPDSLYDQKIVEGVLPDTDTFFKATMLPEGQGFTVKFSDETKVVSPGDMPVEYWRKDPLKVGRFNKFRLIPT